MNNIHQELLTHQRTATDKGYVVFGTYLQGSQNYNLDLPTSDRELHGKQITLVFVEEDGNNILGFRYDDTMYVFDSNIN